VPHAALAWSLPEHSGLPPTASYERIIDDRPPVVGYYHPGLVHLVRHTSQRGTHRSVRALNADIRTWNDNPRSYVWTKTADQILDSIARYCTRINDLRH
jgi:hypothetical protein